MADDRRLKLQAQHARWMEQRAVAQAAAATHSEGPNAGAATHASISLPAAQGAAEVVDRLDEAVKRMSEQVRYENARRGSAPLNQPTGQSAACAAHRCPICLLSMLPASPASNDAIDRSPMLLVPCGHALCRTCATDKLPGCAGACPQCRCIVQSVVLNRPLLQAVAALAERRTADDGYPGECSVPSMDCAAQLRLRVSLLEEESESAALELTALEAQIVMLGQKLAHHTEEEKRLHVEASRLLMRREATEQKCVEARTVLKQREVEVARFEEESALLEVALANVRRDREKCLLMVEHYGPPELLAQVKDELGT
eukprot:gnl/TRDRNA2_/TRDRNA2_197473_c0_seq1.p1 gnl/TRDRNA2_/TRDRNA2_197473_c0~~gnl/TRDRNA2_/TRDRNA2_197473_c0_seq1.p1  ORF type:complete len:314 (+),score=61.84 gnl/TRDRNA2_/TRDRNA2_197473_c0_seq1:174-1115(+)